MRITGVWLLTLLFLGMSACTKAPFTDPVLAPLPPLSAATVLAKQWWNQDGVMRMRQSVVLQMGFEKMAAEGFMVFDTQSHILRLVAMDPMAIKLFDLEVSSTSVTTHYIMPQLAKIPGLADVVANSIRRIFIAPHPSPNDTLERDKTTLVMVRRSQYRTLRFVFGGAEALLLETEVIGREENWRVRYYEHQMVDKAWVPFGVVMADRQAGFKLTIWVEKATRQNG